MSSKGLICVLSLSTLVCRRHTSPNLCAVIIHSNSVKPMRVEDMLYSILHTCFRHVVYICVLSLSTPVCRHHTHLCGPHLCAFIIHSCVLSSSMTANLLTLNSSKTEERIVLSKFDVWPKVKTKLN